MSNHPGYQPGYRRKRHFMRVKGDQTRLAAQNYRAADGVVADNVWQREVEQWQVAVPGRVRLAHHDNLARLGQTIEPWRLSSRC